MFGALSDDGGPDLLNQPKLHLKGKDEPPDVYAHASAGRELGVTRKGCDKAISGCERCRMNGLEFLVPSRGEAKTFHSSSSQEGVGK